MHKWQELQDGMETDTDLFALYANWRRSKLTVLDRCLHTRHSMIFIITDVNATGL